MNAPLVVRGEALASLELATIARGIVVLDAMAKRAETTFVASRTVSPGRYWVLISGGVAEVEEALDAALEIAQEDRVAHVILRDPARALVDALASQLDAAMGESLLIVETTAISWTLVAIDRVLKETDASLLELRFGAGLSGKGVFTLTGALHMVEAARDVVIEVLSPQAIIRTELIAQPHPDLPSRLLEAEGAALRGPKKSG